jgi:purine nucleosidase
MCAWEREFVVLQGRVGRLCEVLVHLDTDLGSDPDDVCALAMLLGSDGVEVRAVTTSSDPGGQRAGYVTYCLDLLGRGDIPVTAGAERSLSHDDLALPATGSRYWPEGVAARPAPRGTAALTLLDSVEAGALVVAIGPYTNLAAMERRRPGTLSHARVVAMGGWVHPPAEGLPAWGPERDYNVQWDTEAAKVVHERAGELTLSTLPVSLSVPLRRCDLPAVRECGAVGALIARQSLAHAEDSRKEQMGSQYPGLPDDLLNFHYDPLACAVAMGWSGAVVDTMRLRPEVSGGGVLRWRRGTAGRAVRVVVDADGAAFRDVWLAAVREAARRVI